jgi:hypothetical protein
MYNFVWVLFVVMDNMITKEMDALERCPDSEWDENRYLELMNYHIKLEREWMKLEDLFFKGSDYIVEASNVIH